MEISEELKEQLEIVRKSKFFLLIFIAALFLSYYVTDLQEEQILCAIEDRDCTALPDTCPPRIAAAVLSLWGLVFFYAATGDALRQPGPDHKTRRQNGLSYLAGLLSLLAGGLRLYVALSACLPRSAADPASSQASVNISDFTQFFSSDVII